MGVLGLQVRDWDERVSGCEEQDSLAEQGTGHQAEWRWELSGCSPARKSHKRLDWGLAPKWRGEPRHRHIHYYQQYVCRNRTVLPLTSHRRSASQFSSW
jgi:hypothetical protein